MFILIGFLEHSPEMRNLEPLRKLAYPIGVWKGLTIDATLSFVNWGGMWGWLNEWVSSGLITLPEHACLQLIRVDHRVGEGLRVFLRQVVANAAAD